MNAGAMRRKSGQTMTEYIIIVAVVALAAIAIFAIFSDTIRAKLGGAVEELGGDTSAKDAALEKDSHQYLKDLDKDGAGS
jgi:Flp pilus assembly pilin Flp